MKEINYYFINNKTKVIAKSMSDALRLAESNKETLGYKSITSVEFLGTLLYEDNSL